jgi:hypothetical protein
LTKVFDMLWKVLDVLDELTNVLGWL